MSVSKSIEQDFLQAIDKLRALVPPVRITAASVAREAGHSRTLISGEKCPYVKVKRLIDEISGRSPGLAPEMALKREIVELKRQNRLLLEQNLMLMSENLRRRP